MSLGGLGFEITINKEYTVCTPCYSLILCFLSSANVCLDSWPLLLFHQKERETRSYKCMINYYVWMLVDSELYGGERASEI